MFIPSKSTVGSGNEQKKATSNVTKSVFDRLATVDPSQYLQQLNIK